MFFFLLSCVFFFTYFCLKMLTVAATLCRWVNNNVFVLFNCRREFITVNIAQWVRREWGRWNVRTSVSRQRPIQLAELKKRTLHTTNTQRHKHWTEITNNSPLFDAVYLHYLLTPPTFKSKKSNLLFRVIFNQSQAIAPSKRRLEIYK